MTHRDAQASADDVPQVAQAEEGRVPRRRERESPDQEMARALEVEIPRIGIREEAIPSVGVRRPIAPSRAEREEHDRTHIPYRDWCECCVRGRGQEDAHRQSSNTGEYQVPQFGADYWFLGGGTTKQEREAAERIGKPPVLVIYEKTHKLVFAHVVPEKGANESVIKKVVSDLDATGFRRGVLRTDQEPAIVKLFKEVKAAWSGDLVLEEAIKGDSDSNGPAEAGVKVVEGLARTYKLALERRCSCILRDEMAIMAWIVEWAALMHRRYMLGTDGLSAYQRLKGKKPSRPVVEIGESPLQGGQIRG